MQIRIDTSTIILTIIFLNILMISILIGYRQKPEKELTIKIFMLAKLVQLLAYIVWGTAILMHATSSISLFRFIGSELLLVAVFCECLAVLMLMNADTKRIKVIYGLMLAAYIAVFFLAYFFNMNEDFRIIVFSMAVVGLIVYPLIFLFRQKSSHSAKRISGIIYLLIMAFFVARALVSGNVFTQNAAIKGEIQSWLLFSLFVLMIFSNCCYLLLVNLQKDMKLIQLANIDELTNILNRRAFNESSQKTIQYCARKNEPVSFMIFDIDNFKKINDTFGHFVGDTVLMEIASMVQSQLRAYDFFGRYGGDEFGVFLPGAAEQNAEAVGERLRTVVESKTIYRHTKLRVTISIGLVTVVPTSDTSLETLYQLGDAALYDAKKAGGNCLMRPSQIIRRGDADGKTG